MLGNDYTGQNCSIARTLELVGERWTILVLRDVFLGVRRFDALQAKLGVARNILATRLDRLVAAGILQKVPYQERPPRYEYCLTEKGLDLWPVIVELLRWGDRYAAPPAGPPVVLRHRECGGLLDEWRICENCGKPLGPRDVRAEPGPGAQAARPPRTPRAEHPPRTPGADAKHPLRAAEAPGAQSTALRAPDATPAAPRAAGHAPAPLRVDTAPAG